MQSPALLAANQKNPFAMSAEQKQIHFVTSMEASFQAEIFFEDMALSVACNEFDEAKNLWSVQVVTDHEIDKADIERRLQLFAEHFGVKVSGFEIQDVTVDMWQNNLEQFPPIRIQNWLIHGSHVTDLPQVSTHNLLIDAGLAFGSGEHATTEGCLTLLKAHLQYLGKTKCRKQLRMLDMGCGSAILAMGAATLAPKSRILAVEIDPVAARVAERNVRINQLQRQIQTIAADGYKSKTVQAQAPYDIILANILARPLMKMAKYLNGVLAPDGAAILSGLLNSQERMVIGAHAMLGLHVKHIWRKAGWSAILMAKQ